MCICKQLLYQISRLCWPWKTATLNNHTTGTDEASMARRCGFLRSNHEIMEAMNADNVPITSRQNLFSEVCQSQFPSELNMCFLFNQMFDVMPIAAIISKAYLVADILCAEPNAAFI
uniref:Uncharacterized protein n=1 Tax=Wuchereria bancrofti TaxID=6293 RepID=A0A1I8EF99_WUCBA